MKILFNALNNYGSTVDIIEDIEMPQFTTEVLSYNNLSLTYSIEQQIDSYVLDLDKRYIMDTHELSVIFDWAIYVPKQTIKEQMFALIKDIFNDNDPNTKTLLTDFLLTYRRLHDNIYMLAAEQQFNIICIALNIAHDARIAACNKILCMLASTKYVDSELKKLI